MATKKFSEFTNASSVTDVDYAVGLQAGSNVKWTLLTIWNYIKSKADGLYATITHTHSNYTPYASVSGTIPANTEKWVRIAASNINVYSCFGYFNVTYIGTAGSGKLFFIASNMFNVKDSIQLVKLSSSNQIDALPLVKRARWVYKKDVSTGEYAYLELLVQNTHPTATLTVSVSGIDLSNIALTFVDGSIPSGYFRTEFMLTGKYPINFLSNRAMNFEVEYPQDTLDIDFNLYGNNINILITSDLHINLLNVLDGFWGTIAVNIDNTSGALLAIASAKDEDGLTLSIYDSGISDFQPGMKLIKFRRSGSNFYYEVSELVLKL